MTREQPNIVLLVLDAASAAHCSCYGYERETTPNLSRIAEAGTRYETAVANSLWTLPAHASLATGQYPHQHRCLDWTATIGNTLIDELRVKGYHTIGCPAIGHGFQDAFDEYSIDPFAGRERLLEGPNLYDDFIVVHRELPEASSFKRGWGYVQEALTSPDPRAHINGLYKFYNRKIRDKWLLNWTDFGTAERLDQIGNEVVSSEDPVFIFSNLVETHFPYKPAQYAEEFLPDDTTSEELRWAVDASFLEGTLSPEGFTPRQEEILTALYDAEIRYTDELIGQLYDRLADSGALEDTVLIVTADHGDTIGGKGVYGHRAEMVPDIMEIPMVAHYPDTTSGTVDGYVEFADLYDHLLSLAGGELEPMTGSEHALTEYYGLDTQHVDLFETHDLDEEFWGRYQVVLHKDGERFHYDSLSDPAELEPPLDEMIESPAAEYARYRGQSVSSERKVSDAAEERLQELGYK